MTPQKQFAIFVAWWCLVSPLGAQESSLVVEKPHAPILVRPYLPATVSPVRLRNSARLGNLIRAGKLYLTVQDAIALAIENNLDLEVDRYGPISAQWLVERQQAGGPLRGVTGGNTLANQNTSGQGVAGSQAAAGLLNGGNGGGGGGGGAATVSQIGPITPNLDAVLQNATAFLHTTTPQPNTTQSQTAALIDTKHLYQNAVTQGLLSGGYVQVSANESYLKENTPTDILNPSVAPSVQIFVRHNFLQGFGTGVNSRFIRVAEMNVGLAQETFRSQLLNLVATVLNLYWDLVGDNEDLKARRLTLGVAQKFYNDTKRQIELSALAKVEIYRAQAELTTRQQELAIAQTAVRQQENLLKNALSRNGLEDPLVDTAEVVPLDSIQVPERDDLPALRELVATAHGQAAGRCAEQNKSGDRGDIGRWEQPTACCRSCRARLRSPTVVCPVLPTRNQTAARLIPIMSVAWEMRWAKSSGRISPAAAPRCFSRAACTIAWPRGTTGSTNCSCAKANLSRAEA